MEASERERWRAIIAAERAAEDTFAREVARIDAMAQRGAERRAREDAERERIRGRAVRAVARILKNPSAVKRLRKLGLL